MSFCGDGSDRLVGEQRRDQDDAVQLDAVARLQLLRRGRPIGSCRSSRRSETSATASGCTVFRYSLMKSPNARRSPCWPWNCAELTPGTVRL